MYLLDLTAQCLLGISFSLLTFQVELGSRPPQGRLLLCFLPAVGAPPLACMQWALECKSDPSHPAPSLPGTRLCQLLGSVQNAWRALTWLRLRVLAPSCHIAFLAFPGTSWGSFPRVRTLCLLLCVPGKLLPQTAAGSSKMSPRELFWPPARGSVPTCCPSLCTAACPGVQSGEGGIHAHRERAWRRAGTRPTSAA